MDRAFSSGASGTPPSAPGSPSTGYATSGNPGTGTPATKPGAYWYHMVTEELRALIVAASLTPDHTNTSQVAQAVKALIAAGAANDYKASVRAATTANIAALAGGAPNTLDGVTLAANDRILVKDQTTGSQNGLYVVTTLGTGANGTWTRATDADGAGELTSGTIVAVEEGTNYADSQWMLSTNGVITIGSTSLTFMPLLPIGVRDGSDALAGRIGEYISSALAFGSAITVSNDVAANVTSISLTPGDWDVQGLIAWPTVGTLTGVSKLGTSCSNVSASPAADSTSLIANPAQAYNSASAEAYNTPSIVTRFSLTVTTTIYLVAFSYFTAGAGTLKAYGSIRARRVR